MQTKTYRPRHTDQDIRAKTYGPRHTGQDTQAKTYRPRHTGQDIQAKTARPLPHSTSTGPAADRTGGGGHWARAAEAGPPKELPRVVGWFWGRVRSGFEMVSGWFRGGAAPVKATWWVVASSAALWTRTSPCTLVTCGLRRHDETWEVVTAVAAVTDARIPKPREAPAYNPTPGPAWPSS